MLLVVEYGCVVWHHNLTTAQSDRLEALQKCALCIILHPLTLPYNTALAYRETESLKLRRYNFQNKFFKQICHPENCLHDLFPPKRDPSVSLRMWHPTVYHTPKLEQIGTAHSLIMHLKSTSDHSFYYYCCTILFILYFVILPCIFIVPIFHCTSYYIFVSVLVL